MTHTHHHTIHHTMAPSGQGTVMLDIGGDIGALIIHTDARWHGHEIEVSPAADPAHRTHAAVRARHISGGVTYCAVIDALPAGTYLIWQATVNPLTHLEVRGGAVTEYAWPAHAVPARGLVSP